MSSQSHLRQASSGLLEEGDSFAALFVGHRASVKKTITRQDVETFAALSGDYNALHVDDEFAARTEFEQLVVHGFVHASLLSNLCGSKIPGQGGLCLSQAFDFRRPVFIGDTVEAIGIVESLDPQTRVIGIRTEIVNQRGERVLEGEAKVKILRLPPTESKNLMRGPAPMADLLKDRVALVTGASRGIGRAIATTLAAHGATVWVNYNRSEGAAQKVVTEISASGGTCFKVHADVTQDQNVATMIDEIVGQGGLNILVNNAGPKIQSAPFEQQTWSTMQTTFDQTVGGVFRVTQAALPHLLQSKGTIVNVLAAAAFGRTTHNWLPYVTAKAALLGFSKNLAQELGPHGVRVNMVSPSLVDTDLVSNIPEKVRQMAVSRTPLRRLATPDDVAGAVLFLVSPYSGFMTGDNLLVTGGDVMV